MKKLIMLSLFTYTLSFTNSTAQGIWTSRDTLPDSAMCQGIPGFSIGSYGYAGLGGQYYSGNLSNKLFQFAPSTNSWIRKADFLGQARVAPACFVIGNKAYLVTGSVRNAGTCVTECWEYDATSNTWTQRANFPGSPRTYAVGFAIDSIGYVGTGANELSDFRKDFYSYHPSTDTWTRIADLPGIARSCASGFAVNGKGYVCFGQDSLINPHWLNGDMWEYDPGTNLWAQKNNCPDSFACYCSSGFVICNNIYVGSGFDSLGGAQPIFWKYNTITNTWTQVANIPGITKIQGAAFAIVDTGYYGFGTAVDSGQVNANIFDEFYNGDSCNINTGSSVINAIPEINIYPNPCNIKCFINLPDSYKTTPEFTLFNALGVKQKVNIQENKDYYILIRGGLREGVYILAIEYKGEVSYQKLVITN